MAKVGLEMKLLTSEVDAEAEKWDEYAENDIVKRAKSMSSMAYNMCVLPLLRMRAINEYAAGTCSRAATARCAPRTTCSRRPSSSPRRRTRCTRRCASSPTRCALICLSRRDISWRHHGSAGAGQSGEERAAGGAREGAGALPAAAGARQEPHRRQDGHVQQGRQRHTGDEAPHERDRAPRHRLLRLRHQGASCSLFVSISNHPNLT